MTYLELLGSIEFWAGLNTGDVVSDSALKSLFTNRLNRKLDYYSSKLGSGSRLSQTDDTNYSDQPYSFFNIVNGQHDYEFLQDEDGNAITDITAVLIKVGDSFRKIDKLSLDENDAELIMSPNSNPGVPTNFLERNNTVFLDPVPNYSLENGGKLFYKRVASYFTTDDTIKSPGIIPKDLQEILSISAALDWLLVNKSNARTLITTVRDMLMKMEVDLKAYQEMRNPKRNRITPKMENTR